MEGVRRNMCGETCLFGGGPDWLILAHVGATGDRLGSFVSLF